MPPDTPLPSPLISASALHALWAAGDTVVLLDCSSDLMDTSAGRRAHAAGHLPGAHHADLGRDLSGPIPAAGSIQGGRHPLPSPHDFAVCLGRWGITPHTRVVAYDAQGACYASRAWWLLRWMGHPAAGVAVLDGGLPAWVAAGGPLESGEVALPTPAAPAYPVPAQAGMPTRDAASLLSRLGQDLIVDARAPERYRGDVEPMDRQAGHIPGARNHFFRHNLGADGCFLPPDQLRAAFDRFGPQHIVHQCGSGVTACHNLLAMAVAGLHNTSLYPGSWSEWSADPSRPVAVGS